MTTEAEAERRIVDSLRERQGHLPTEVVSHFGSLLDSDVTHGAVVIWFKKAFPKIPLRTLLECGAWHRFGGKMSDDEFNAMLAPWITDLRTEQQR